MKNIIFVILIILSTMGLLLVVQWHTPTESNQVAQNQETITTITECQEQAYIEAIAKDNEITLEEAEEIHQKERPTDDISQSPYSEKYYHLSQRIPTRHGYSLACSATAYMLVDKENPDCVAQVLGVHFPEISLYGECSNVRWSGNTAIVYDEETYDSKIIRIFANGEMHFDVSSDLSFEGADAFNEVGEKTFSTKADDYLLQEQFVWRLKTIAVNFS